MTDYLLRNALNSDDVAFLNETDMVFELVNTHGLKPETDAFDSGWCDAETGARLINQYDRVVFKNLSPEDLTYLMVRYSDRLKLLTADMENIYNYRDDI